MGIQAEVKNILTAKKLTHEQKAEVAGTAALVAGLASTVIPILIVPAVSSAGMALFEQSIADLDEADEQDSKTRH